MFLLSYRKKKEGKRREQKPKKEVKKTQEVIFLSKKFQL